MPLYSFKLSCSFKTVPENRNAGQRPLELRCFVVVPGDGWSMRNDATSFCGETGLLLRRGAGSRIHGSRLAALGLPSTTLSFQQFPQLVLCRKDRSMFARILRS